VTAEPRLVEVRKNVLKQNDLIARALRERIREAGVLAVSLVSSPGSGKTAFLEETDASSSLPRGRGAGGRPCYAK
jgi:hydrogenase nickel incorporation protein HypB